ncbi:DUF397 domain-containing protein [Actinomadura parmotrematis]|uniref:DUF397 domain-containing protein n=1 Tax=Actinomadura parmotrematis TaxID=2864039 RepID=A0ABS7FVA6_9ACTN|nr:DUF397 domain-containing protein [Actinomadura parmotrematis]MBW8484338.1 DUF397 domain-containing protein [Actinomadura parmotrematis]
MINWRKSSHSNAQGGDCVELADLGYRAASPGTVGLRDSKAPGAGHLALTRATLATLFTTLKAN